MYGVVRRYQGIDPGAVDEIMRKGTERLLPIIKETPGFVAHYVLNAEGGVMVSVSLFEDRAGAEDSTRRVLDRIGQESIFPNPPEVIRGEVISQTGR